MSKSQLRRLEVTHPELVAEIGEQIAREIESRCDYKFLRDYFNGGKDFIFKLCTHKEDAAIARGDSK